MGIPSEEQEIRRNFDEKKSNPFIDVDDKRNIWTVGGGKGGTGKSFISANLAVYLSFKENNIVLIDADLGGPNLHSLLGVKEARFDLGDFMANDVQNLENIATVTPFSGLKLVKGTNNVLFMANLNYFKKLRLIKKIKSIDANRIIVDIGTGTSYNSLDFFILSNHGILVINPEPTSIENAYLFLKACMMRILKSYTEYHMIKDFKKILSLIERDSDSIYSFLNNLISYNSRYARLLYEALKKFKPFLIINKARNEKDFILGKCVADVVQKYLAIDLNFLGIVPYDDRVHLSLKRYEPFLTAYPDSETSNSIKTIAEKLIEETRYPFV